MADLVEIVCCPNCGGDMSLAGDDLCCGCGYCLDLDDNFFKMRNKPDKIFDYAKYYTEEYYTSSLYDYTPDRLNKIVSLARPQKGRRILDLGCGPGEVAVRCAKLGAEVFGIDVSRDALRLSAERSVREKARVNLFEFDGKRVPFRGSTFDSIILSDVVEHVDDETLDSLVKECARLLGSDGRVIIHTAPTKNIIVLSKILKMVSCGRIDLYSRLVNPDYEFLHIRYHSQGSLRGLLRKSSLHPIMWGEFRYLSDYKLPKLLVRLGMGEIFSDQLWCVAFKDKRRFLELKHDDKPHLGLIEPSSEIDLGRCDELYFNYGFYDSELESFRWTKKKASLYIDVPENYHRIDIKLHTSNPDIHNKPVRVDLRLGGRLISSFDLSDCELQTYSSEINENIKTGIAELEVKVDRAFVPKEYGLNEDTRELGVAIYKVMIV